MTNCANCGTTNPDGAKFCLNCGTKLAQICPACGTELPADAKFCLNCGHRLTGRHHHLHRRERPSGQHGQRSDPDDENR